MWTWSTSTCSTMPPTSLPATPVLPSTRPTAKTLSDTSSTGYFQCVIFIAARRAERVVFFAKQLKPSGFDSLLTLLSIFLDRLYLVFLTRISDARHPPAPFFLFGDFNFRLDALSLVQVNAQIPWERLMMHICPAHIDPLFDSSSICPHLRTCRL